MNYQEAARQFKEALRLRSEPLGVSFLTAEDAFPDKARRPSQVFGKKVTICQGVTMARLYGWPVLLTRDDLICVPGMLAFGFAPVAEPGQELAQLMCEVGFHQDIEPARQEATVLVRFAPGEISAVYLSPLERLAIDPHVVVVYGNPAQIMRLVQGAVFSLRERVRGDFGGKVECSSYLVGPQRDGSPRVAIPGLGDRVFSMTQDDELVFSFPTGLLPAVLKGLTEAARRIGARYPVTCYQNFSPEFPPPYKERAEKWGIA